jgi:hypothetical protein
LLCFSDYTDWSELKHAKHDGKLMRNLFEERGFEVECFLTKKRELEKNIIIADTLAVFDDGGKIHCIARSG